MVGPARLSDAVEVQRTRRQASLVEATQTALRQRRRRRAADDLAGSLATETSASDPDALARWEHDGGAVAALDRSGALSPREPVSRRRRSAASVVSAPFDWGGTQAHRVRPTP